MAETSAEVIFSGTDVANMRVDSSATGEVARAGQLAMWMLFAGHLFADMGQKPWALELSDQLAGMNEQERSTFLEVDDLLGVHVRTGEPPAPRVGFGAWLFHEDEVRPSFFLLADQRHWRLNVHMPWRERVRGKHYFGTAPALLLQHLVRQNAGDAFQQERLFDSATIVAELHRNGELGLPIRWTQAVTVAAESVWGVAASEGTKTAWLGRKPKDAEA
jgi:hypothetical protein